ncbi:MAG: DNA/RNA non-specific endonuclease [Bacteroidales bacterium]|nr:DNA/RNA non-specific endonuclease [Bacteroidales bacterium]
MSTGGATLHGSFADATGTIYTSGFVWGTDESCNSGDIQLGSQTGMSGELSFDLTGLTAGRTYYYRAYVQVWDEATSTAVPFYGDPIPFTTLPAESGIPDHGWLELPQLEGNESFVGTFYGSGAQTDNNRNYSYNYNYGYFASLWTAYPLTNAHTTGSANTNDWYYNPNINTTYQINMTGNSYPTMYGANNYSKGHQCPDADRKSDSQMNRQTYFCTNQTPQIQNGFNGSIWSALENAVRGLTATSDTVYVVTGPVYQKVGGSEEITYLHAVSGKNAYPENVPVPNYYWKALLKVKWSGDQIQSASAIGFWFPHQVLTGRDYFDSDFVVSVDQIEEWTGFDLFHNLPNDKEASAEANTSWTTFQSF